MTLTLPTRVPMLWVGAFVTIMFTAMTIEGTGTLFCILFVAHVVLSALAFNAAGGFSKVIGAYVCFFSVFTLIFGVTWKTLIGQAADTNLANPLLDISLYTVSMAALLGVVYLLNEFDVRQYSLATTLDAGNVDFSKIGLGCLLMAFFIQFLDITLGATPGGILSIINQLNIFLAIAILMGTIGAIQNSNGRSSIDTIAGISLVLTTIIGTLAFSKQGMIEPAVCWLVGAAYMKFRLRTIHFISFIPVLYFILFMANPIAGLRVDVPPNGTYTDRVTILINGLTHWDALKQRQRESEAFRVEHSEGATYFGTDQGGLVERSTMIPVDDSLFGFSAAGHYVGYDTILWDFENWVPHFIFPGKHTGYSGNYYVHEMGGGLAEDDYTTGISFSPVAEAFHVGGWIGVIFLMPAIWILWFVVTDFTVGDVNKSPWGMLAIVFLAHAAPESLLSGLIQGIAYGNLAIAFAMFFSIKLAPIIGSLLYGSGPQPAAPPAVMRARTT